MAQGCDSILNWQRRLGATFFGIMAEWLQHEARALTVLWLKTLGI